MWSMLAAAIFLCGCMTASAQVEGPEGDLAPVTGLSCPAAGYMWPDAENLCFVWFCETAGDPPIKQACPKGARVPTWWEGGYLNMCFQVNIEKHGGQNICLRCDVDDAPIDDSCASGRSPCPEECDCIDIEYTHRCDCPVELGAIVAGGGVGPAVDHCDPDPCLNGGTCQNQWDGYFCFCDARWTGHSCEWDICEWDPCMNGGTCVVDDIGYHCLCTDCWGGACCNETRADSANCVPVRCDACFTGPDCRTRVNSCACSPCSDEEECTEGTGGANCNAITCAPCQYVSGGQCVDITGTCECNNPCDLDTQACVEAKEINGQVTCKDGNPSSGTSFAVMFEENNTEDPIEGIPLELYVSAAVPDDGTRSVNIQSAALDPADPCYFSADVVVPENDVYRFAVDRCMRHDGTGIKNLGIKVTETNGNTIILYGMNKQRYTNDGFLATPDDSAGKKFQTASYAPAHIATQFGIVAIEDNTRVSIEFSDDNDLGVPAGSVYQVVLNAYQTFQVQARCPDAPGLPIEKQCALDLSGSVIESDKPIHVFSGNVRAFIKAGEARSRDHLVEEMIPIKNWGKMFGLVSIPGRTVGDLLNIMAIKGQVTTVRLYKVNHEGGRSMDMFTLPQNGRVNTYKEIASGGQFYIESDMPISVTLLTKSKTPSEDFHDPASITISPVSQFTNNFFISTPMFSGGAGAQPKPYHTNLAMLVALHGDEEGITLNGRALQASDFVENWMHLPTPDGSEGTDLDLMGCVIRLEHGTSLIRNKDNKNFQCLVYGFDDRETYGFPAAINHLRLHDM